MQEEVNLHHNIGREVHIILPVHNRIEITKQFIDCLSEQTYSNYRLILVDDGSTDGTAEYVQSRVGKLTILKGNGNLWWAGALNKAQRHLTRNPVNDDDVVLIINDDTTFAPDYLQNLVADEALSHESIVVSPGHCPETQFTEYGFLIDWEKLAISQMQQTGKPDAITTRGLYMYFLNFAKIGGFHPRLLPHYLSDLEYTIRAQRKNLKLVISERTKIVTNRALTGTHTDESKNMREFLYNNLVSKRSAFNAYYRGNFALLAAPKGMRVRIFVLSWSRFFKRLREFSRTNFPKLRNSWRYIKRIVRR